MNIVFYSSSSNIFSGEERIIKTYPLRRDCFDSLALEYPEHRFSVVTQMPGSFLLDIKSNDIEEKSELVSYTVTEEISATEFAGVILEKNPDIAIAMTFWTPPYDWMGLKDSMIADELRKHGVDAVCSPQETQLICFDKKNTADFLNKNGFPCPPSVYVHHEYFWAERGNKSLLTNNYKDFILSEVAAMDFPVVIKDCVGLSSYGMEVAVSYAQAVHYLKNGRNVSDRLVEKYIDGIHFGAEIYGRKGHYKVLPPMIFSLNRYGITSPKLSIKAGPVVSDKLDTRGLISMLGKLADSLGIDGSAQVDLVFSGGKWFVIEINPRLSGMSETYAAAMGKTLLQVMVETALGHAGELPEPDSACNFKLPLLSDGQIERLTELPQIKYLHQHNNKGAKQEREKGYCEAVVKAEDGNLLSALEKTRSEIPEIFEGQVWENIKGLLDSEFFFTRPLTNLIS